MRAERPRHGGVVGVAQGRADHPAAVVRLLIVTLDVPGGVVGDDEHGPGAVPHRGVHLHRVDAEGAVAVDRDHLARREGERRRDAERHADAEAAERARIHVGARRREADARKAQKVAAVGDRDVVGSGDLGDGIEDAARMDLAVRPERGRVAEARRGALQLAPTHRLGPAGIEVWFRVAHGLDDRVQRQCRRGQDLGRAPPIVDQLARRVGDADEAGVRKHRRRAVAELIVELAPDHDDEIGLGHRLGPDRAGERRVIERHQPAALLGVEVERARRIEQPDQRRLGAARAAPGDHERAARPPDQPRRLLDRRRVGRQCARRLGRQPVFEHQRRRDVLAQHVGRDLEVHGTRFAEVARGPGDRLVQLAQHLVGDAQRCARGASRAAGCPRAGCPAAAPC